MSKLRSTLRENLLKNREGLSNSSLKTYLTSLHGTKAFDTAKEQKQIMTNMGSSTAMIKTYVKVD